MNGIRFGTDAEAIQHADASRSGVAIRYAGAAWVVAEPVADALATGGESFAYLCEADGRIVTIPVN